MEGCMCTKLQANAMLRLKSKTLCHAILSPVLRELSLTCGTHCPHFELFGSAAAAAGAARLLPAHSVLMTVKPSPSPLLPYHNSSTTLRPHTSCRLRQEKKKCLTAYTAHSIQQKHRDSSFHPNSESPHFHCLHAAPLPAVVQRRKDSCYRTTASWRCAEAPLAAASAWDPRVGSEVGVAGRAAACCRGLGWRICLAGLSAVGTGAVPEQQ